MSSTYYCVTASTLDEIKPHVPAWQGLISQALEDNFYLSPAFLMAALRHYSPHGHLVVFVYRRSHDGDQLMLVAPFSLRGPTFKKPFTFLRTFASPHGYLSHPLVSRDDAVEVLNALWEWLEQPTHPWRMVLIPRISETSPFLPKLTAMLNERGGRFLSRDMFMRPMLDRFDNFDAYLASLPSARRKHYRRRWKQLQNAGDIEVILHRNLSRAGDLAERFLQLEMSSWKGAQGTAMACASDDADFFREVVAYGTRTGNLFFIELRLNGKTIAMTSNFVVRNTLFAFKIAYDPAYERYSPGILAEVQTVRVFHETPGLTKGEGGAVYESYLRSYWRNLTEMRVLYIAMPHVLPRCYLSLLSASWQIKDACRAMLQKHSWTIGSTSPAVRQSRLEMTLLAFRPLL